MEERFAPIVFIHQHEGGTVDGGIAGEAATDALGKAGFAGAKVSAEQDDVTLTEDAPEAFADVAGLFFTGGSEFEVVLLGHCWEYRQTGRYAIFAW